MILESDQIVVTICYGLWVQGSTARTNPPGLVPPAEGRKGAAHAKSIEGIVLKWAWPISKLGAGTGSPRRNDSQRDQDVGLVWLLCWVFWCCARRHATKN